MNATPSHKQQLNACSRPIIWTIAGSDSSGGAGIQADIKTGHALGCEVCTLITANTVQNSHQLFSVNSVNTEVLEQQFDALITDKPPMAIKIGLIANNSQLAWLANKLAEIKKHYPNCKVVFDPVMQASVGQNLTQEAIDRTLLNALFKNIDIITPNLPEIEWLTEQKLSNSQAEKNTFKTLKTLAELLLAEGIQHVLLTGGHAENNDNQVTDNCISASQTLTLISDRIETQFSHGSGCTFASAMASFLALGYLVRDAFMHSKAFINKAFVLSQIEEQQKLTPNKHTGYYGALIQPSWPVEKQYYPKVKAPQQSTAGFKSIGLQKLGLYPVIDSLPWLQRLLPLGLEIIQLRLKHKTNAELDELIAQAVAMARPYQTRLFINDHWQLAIKHQAYGVHLGQEDIESADLSAIKDAGLRLGISTHGIYEFKLAEQLQPSYLAIGAIFPTKTKDMTGQIQGLNNLQQILALQTSDIPVVAIGGISLHRAPQVLQTGVQCIAVVTAITEADNPEVAVKKFNDYLKRA